MVPGPKSFWAGGQMRTIATFGVQVLASAIIISAFGAAQEGTRSAQLRIALSKRDYFPGEAVVVTYRITNSSSSLLLCFPPPAIDCNSISGQLAATATPPKGVAVPKISGGCAADRWIDRDAGYDIDQHWIKIAPLQSYEITKESHSIGLIAPGRWAIEAGYVPMREDTQSLYENAMKERGCSNVPELHSAKAAISVRTPTN
jgi:hypothetical protein